MQKGTPARMSQSSWSTTSAFIGSCMSSKFKVMCTSPCKPIGDLSTALAEWLVGLGVILANLRKDLATNEEVAPVSTTIWQGVE